jgi:hypothetical protein
LIEKFAIGAGAAADEEGRAERQAMLSVACTVPNEDEEAENIFSPKKD